jgi:hypothetical protein
MENRAMSDPTKLQIKIWGISISAEGVIGAAATVLIVLALILSQHF